MAWCRPALGTLHTPSRAHSMRSVGSAFDLVIRPACRRPADAFANALRDERERDN